MFKDEETEKACGTTTRFLPLLTAFGHTKAWGNHFDFSSLCVLTLLLLLFVGALLPSSSSTMAEWRSVDPVCSQGLECKFQRSPRAPD